jgi:hypothetical protein
MQKIQTIDTELDMYCRQLMDDGESEEHVSSNHIENQVLESLDMSEVKEEDEAEEDIKEEEEEGT